MKTHLSAVLVILVGLGAVPAAAQTRGGENGTGTFWNEPGAASGQSAEALRTAARTGGSVTLTGTPYAVVVPPRHVVQRGDTLWDICTAKLHNPWLWPEVWSLNPEITNPHWIYPGQVIRLRSGDPNAYGWGDPQALYGLQGGTVFFRNEGFIDATDESDVDEPPGTIVASWEDEMMLAYPDVLYVRFREDFPVQAGQQYTIYRFRETVYDTVEDEEGDPVELGRVVEILGTGTILSVDPDAHLARVKVIESINPIERGDVVGPIERNYIVSAPRAAEVDLDGQIVATMRPRVVNGQGHVVFINRGYDAGVRDGNRFQLIRATDHYLQNREEEVPPDLPFEWVGECQVLEARKNASTCLITASTRELEVGERATLIRGQ